MERGLKNGNVFYADLNAEKICCLCAYAKMRRDICGIYCTTGRVENGRCSFFKEWRKGERNANKKEASARR